MLIDEIKRLFPHHEILKEIVMPDKSFDNGNRGGLWKGEGLPPLSGKADVGGRAYYATLIPTGAKSDKAPVYKIFLEDSETRDVYGVSVWNDEKDNDVVYSGSKQIIGDESYWVGLRRGRTETREGRKIENPPVFELSFLPLSDGEAPSSKPRTETVSLGSDY